MTTSKTTKFYKTIKLPVRELIVIEIHIRVIKNFKNFTTKKLARLVLFKDNIKHIKLNKKISKKLQKLNKRIHLLI